MNDRLYMGLISCLPKKQVARAMGAVAGWDGASVISKGIARQFAAAYDLNMAEAELPLEAYPNLLSLFTRKLKPGARPIDPDLNAIVSPVDGVMSEHGLIDGNMCTQVKGKLFSVDDLVGGPERGRAYHGGHFMTIYLSPRHYHRIHSPVSGDIVGYQHIPGHLFPVNGPSVRTVDRLFAVNERLTSYVRVAAPGSPPGAAHPLPEGNPEVAVVKVGAIGVGRIRLSYCEAVTNRPGQVAQDVPVVPSMAVSRGDELGVFELGSTVVMLFPPGLVRLEEIPVGQEVRLGQRIGTRL